MYNRTLAFSTVRPQSKASGRQSLSRMRLINSPELWRLDTRLVASAATSSVLWEATVWKTSKRHEQRVRTTPKLGALGYLDTARSTASLRGTRSCSFSRRVSRFPRCHGSPLVPVLSC